MVISAPMRVSSAANIKRFSNRFSVITEFPCANAASSINCACKSVGNPGCGSV